MARREPQRRLNLAIPSAITDEDLARLKAAAALRSQDLGAFVLEAALSRADEVLLGAGKRKPPAKG